VRELPGGVGREIGTDSDGLASSTSTGRKTVVLAGKSCSLNTTSRDM
jgi:hypothetical protein